MEKKNNNKNLSPRGIEPRTAALLMLKYKHCALPTELWRKNLNKSKGEKR